MIYLIDDNKNNMRASQFGVFFVEQGMHNSVLKSVTKLTKGTDLSFLKDATCILIHKTMEDSDQSGNYMHNSHENVNEIIETVADYGSKIPLVIFSNKMQTTEYDPRVSPNCVFQINKKLFYNRLHAFVDLYQRENQIEFLLLTEGFHYQTAEADRLANKILDSLTCYSSDNPFRLNLIDLEVFERFYAYAGMLGSSNAFIEELELAGTSVKQFKDNISLINESITLYGTNIHTWKR